MHNIALQPHDLLAEKGYLSCILHEPNLLAQCKINKKDFYDSKYGEVFDKMKKLYKQKVEVNSITLASGSTLEVDYLFDIATAELTPSGFTSYEKIIRNKSLYRGVIKSANKMVALAYDEGDWGDIHGELNAITNQTVGDDDDGISHIEAASNYLETLGQETGRICRYGYKYLDATLGGLRIGQLVILGAGPGVGKSLFAVNLIERIIKQSKKVAMFALEMTDQEIMARMVAKWSGITIKKLDTEGVDVKSVTKSVIENISEDHKFTIFRKTFGFGRILNHIRRLHIQQGLDVVVIDYLQLIKVETKDRMTKDERVGIITRELKCLAQELGIAIITLSQFNREGRKNNEEPTLMSLRDSGNIEQDANVVLLLHSDEYMKGKINTIVAKNRNGEKGSIMMGIDYGLMKLFTVKQESYD